MHPAERILRWRIDSSRSSIIASGYVRFIGRGPPIRWSLLPTLRKIHILVLQFQSAADAGVESYCHCTGFGNNKYRLEICDRGHGPAHRHSVGGNVDVIIELATLASNGQWPKGLRAEVLAWVEANLDEL